MPKNVMLPHRLHAGVTPAEAQVLAASLCCDCGSKKKPLCAVVRGDRIVFVGGKAGEHSLALSVSSPERIRAHWAGYCENNGCKKSCGTLPSGHGRAEPRIQRLGRSEVNCFCGEPAGLYTWDIPGVDGYVDTCAKHARAALLRALPLARHTGTRSGGGANMVGPSMPYYATMRMGGGGKYKSTVVPPKEPHQIYTPKITTDDKWHEFYGPDDVTAKTRKEYPGEEQFVKWRREFYPVSEFMRGGHEGWDGSMAWGWSAGLLLKVNPRNANEYKIAHFMLVSA